MITFLTSPKPFEGIALTNQTNAVKSWLALHPEIEVILYGNTPGAAEACERLGAQHVPHIDATPAGIPYFGAIASHADKHARYDVQVYLNSDVLLTPHILRAIGCIPFTDFLMIGQRIDLAEGVVVDTVSPELPNQLKMMADNGQISLHTPGGSDYFIFRKGMWLTLPPVIIGRGGYDNALIAYCLQRGIPIVDATLAIPVMHQFHGYGHATGGVKEVFEGEDARRNLAFVPKDAVPVLEDANYLLRDSALSAIKCRGDWLRFLFMKYRYNNVPVLPSLLRELWRLQIKLGLRHRWKPTLHEVLKSYQGIRQEVLL